jgi:hypothetical protein
VVVDEPFFKGGTKEFLNRQDTARLRALDKELLLNRFNGVTWKNQATVPKPQYLNTERRCIEKELKSGKSS